MERNRRKIVSAAVLATVLVGGFATAGSAVASTTTAAQAKVIYDASIADAQGHFIASVRPSRATMINEGKRAESMRRSTVKRALTAFDAVVTAEKIASLTAEKTYKASVLASAANPTNLTLKAAIKTNLASLKKATAALSTDPKIAIARVSFAKARVTAMGNFKSILEISAKERATTLDRATARYKSDKARALAALHASTK